MLRPSVSSCFLLRGELVWDFLRDFRGISVGVVWGYDGNSEAFLHELAMQIGEVF